MKALGDLYRDLLFSEDFCFYDLLKAEYSILIDKMGTENIDMDQFSVLCQGDTGDKGVTEQPLEL